MNILVDPAETEAGSPDLFNYPFIHMTGHGNVVFNNSDLKSEQRCFCPEIDARTNEGCAALLTCHAEGTVGGVGSIQNGNCKCHQVDSK